MDKPNIVITYTASQEQQALLLELLGDVASLTFLTELAPTQREQALLEGHHPESCVKSSHLKAER